LKAQEKHFREMYIELDTKNKKTTETLTKLYLKMDELDEENDKKDAELELFKNDYEVAM